MGSQSIGEMTVTSDSDIINHHKLPHIFGKSFTFVAEKACGLAISELLISKYQNDPIKKTVCMVLMIVVKIKIIKCSLEGIDSYIRFPFP